MGIDLLIEVVALVLGIAIVLWIDRQRRPQLSMSVGIPGTIDQADPLNRPATTFLHELAHPGSPDSLRLRIRLARHGPAIPSQWP
jgi:hypothetical protein